MTHQGTNSIETKRLLLRRYRREDAKDLYLEVYRNPLVTRHVDWKPHPNPYMTQELVELYLRRYDTCPAFYNWAIEYDGRAIGAIGAFHVDDTVRSCELGYNLGSWYWGQGLMSEAVEAVLGYLFREVGFHRVAASCHAMNPASEKVLQRVGMTHEGTLRSAVLCRGGILDDLKLYGILEQELPDSNSE